MIPMEPGQVMLARENAAAYGHPAFEVTFYFASRTDN